MKVVVLAALVLVGGSGCDPPECLSRPGPLAMPSSWGELFDAPATVTRIEDARVYFSPDEPSDREPDALYIEGVPQGHDVVMGRSGQVFSEVGGVFRFTDDEGLVFEMVKGNEWQQSDLEHLVVRSAPDLPSVCLSERGTVLDSYRVGVGDVAVAGGEEGEVFIGERAYRLQVFNARGTFSPPVVEAMLSRLPAANP